MFKARILAPVTLIAALLAGCGGNGGSTPAPASTAAGSAASSTPAASTDKKEQVTLKFHFWYNEDQDNWKAVYKAFEDTHPNIKIEAVTAGDNNSIEYLKKLDLAAASGDQIDVMMFSAPQYYAQRAAINMLEPLNDYIAKDGYKVADEYALDPTINGKTYGLPAKKVTFFVLLNKKHLDEAGLPVPTDWTWDEFKDYAKKLTKGEGTNKRYGTYFHTFPIYYQLLQNTQDNNRNLYLEDNKTLNIDTPLIRSGLDLLHQMMDVDKTATPYNEVISQKLNYRPQYFNEKASMIVTGDFMIPETGGTDKVPANFTTVFAPLPKVNKNDPNNVNPASDIVSVYSKSKHKQEAYEFVRWYTTEGIQLQGKYIPSWKKADLAKSLDKLIAGSKTPDKVDKTSLLRTMQNVQSGKFLIPASFHDELDRAYVKEVEAYLLGQVDMNTAIKNAVTKGQDIISKAK